MHESPVGLNEDQQMRNSLLSSRGNRLALLMGALLVLAATTAAADSWYEHYEKADEALSNEDWPAAVREINAALEKKGDSGARVRSYGMNVTSYFPYFKLGLAYYHLGQYEAALQAFETELRLGAIAETAGASEQLAEYQALARSAHEQASRQQLERVREIVERGLGKAEAHANDGSLQEAIAELDYALAVAPGDERALAAMGELRQRLAESRSEQERVRSVSRLTDEARLLLASEEYARAAAVLRQAYLLVPNAETAELLDTAQRGLASQLGKSDQTGTQPVSISARLEEVRSLESAGRLSEALDRLESVLLIEPGNTDALSIQGRLLRQSEQQASRAATLASIDRLLAEADTRLQLGSAEASLSAANQVLALDPGNSEALAFVSEAYVLISRRLLGEGTAGNLPPAVRFVDYREEQVEGILLQVTRSPEFRLTGVIIDNTTVDVVFYRDDDAETDAGLSSQPLGDMILTEFDVRATLPPGESTFRLVATDMENLVSSSEYTVRYVPPVYRAAWFYAVLLGIVAISIAMLSWRRRQQRLRMRTRRYNPYVAGAPVLDEDMFFGRRELVDRILQTIHNNSLLIYGERRIGKTSIQHQLKRRLENLVDPGYVFHPVYVDLQGTPETRFFGTIADDVFDELAASLDGLRPGKDTAGEYDYRDFVRDIREVIKALQRRTVKHVKLVLLIDEVDELNEYDPRINQKLRSLFMKNFAENMVAVVSGVEIKKQWEREGSPWYNFFEEIEVEPLAPQEARDLIERPIESIFRLEGGVVERIIALTAGKPYLIQKLCVSLVTRLYAQHRSRITVADVDEVAGQLLDARAS